MQKKYTGKYQNEIKFYIFRIGVAMSEIEKPLVDEYSWSRSSPKLPHKLKQGSLYYGKVMGLMDMLVYGLVRQKCREVK